jgi:sulfite exporter TauE/SafE
MDSTLAILIGSALLLGFVHTISGPDHYLPFVAMSQTRGWSITKTLWIVTICGIGHVLGSVVLGLIGISFGIAVGTLEYFEGVRGSLASWLLFTAGVIYTVWAIIHRIRNPHHEHSHMGNKVKNKKSLTFWVLFTIFVFGPCEPLIPILIYPAAKLSISSVLLVSFFFALTTLATMLASTYLLLKGINLTRMHRIESYQHILAGSTLLLSGAGIIFLGL